MSGEIMAVEETLWGENAMKDMTMSELITQAVKTIEEISKRWSQVMTKPYESVFPNVIVNDHQVNGVTPRREFVAPNGVRPENHRRLWREDEIETVQALRFAGWSNARIAAQMNRSPRAIEKIITREKERN